MKHPLRLVAGITVVGAALVLWSGSFALEGSRSGVRTNLPAAAGNNAFRIGLAPEHDVFHLRRSYRELASYLEGKIGRPVELVTLRSYDDALQELANRDVEAAFVGSLVAVLAIERCGAVPLVRPEMSGGVSGCRGVLFVKAASPIGSVDEMRGRSLGIVPGTSAGCLVPVSEMQRRGMLNGPGACRLLRLGTYDQVIDAVVSGEVEVGAVKDLLLDSYEATHPNVKFRRLLTSAAIPHNAMVMRGDLAGELERQLRQALCQMDQEPAGRQALEALGVVGFVRCGAEEYAAVYDRIAAVGEGWRIIGVSGEPPGRQVDQAERLPASTSPGESGLGDGD